MQPAPGAITHDGAKETSAFGIRLPATRAILVRPPIGSVRQLGARPLDLHGVAKAVQHDVGAERAKASALPSPMPLMEPVTMAVLP
jgi:hypothetical protein